MVALRSILSPLEEKDKANSQTRGNRCPHGFGKKVELGKTFARYGLHNLLRLARRRLISQSILPVVFGMVDIYHCGVMSPKRLTSLLLWEHLDDGSTLERIVLGDDGTEADKASFGNALR